MLLIGDWNAKVGYQQGGEEGVVGPHGLPRERSENGERFVELRANNNNNNMVITTSCIPIKISTSTHGYHQAPKPETRSIMLLCVESLQDQF